MTRLIDADALRKNMEFVCMGIMAGTESYNAPLTEIDNAPTIEYTFEEAFQKTVCEQGLYCPKRPHGKWEQVSSQVVHCSCCNKNSIDMSTYVKMNYCPICGAKMDKEADDV